MPENQVNSDKLLNTTDSLEAIGLFKAWKNFMFIVVFVFIILLQTAFWLEKLRLVRDENQEDTVIAVVEIEQEVERRWRRIKAMHYHPEL